MLCLALSSCAAPPIPIDLELDVDARAIKREAGWLLGVPYDAFVTARDESPAAVRSDIVATLRDPLTAIARPRALAQTTLESHGLSVDFWSGFATMRSDADPARCTTAAIVAAIEAWLDIAIPLASTFGARLPSDFVRVAGDYLARDVEADALFDAARDTPAPSTAEIRRLGEADATLARHFRAVRDCDFSAEFARPRSIVTRQGTILLGSFGNDIHAPEDDISFVFDPAGDDRYQLTSVLPGRVRGIADLAGNDRYDERGATVGGVSLMLDFGGDDRYDATAGGQAAAIFGRAMLFDSGGNNRFAAGFFAQAAAFAGAAFLVGGLGDDVYAAGDFAQAAATAGGIAALIELGGNDRYTAGGVADAYGRGGGISMAQGAGFGIRGRTGGGLAILNDLAGDDIYVAEQFAQGMGYALGFGVLIDESGADAYTAARYAQGAGIHGGIGLLVDRAGNDTYRVETAVAQGVAIDNGIGVLADLGGVDEFGADQLAQAGTNGGGIAALIVKGAASYNLRTSYAGGNWGGLAPTASFPGFAYADLGLDAKLARPRPNNDLDLGEALTRARPEPQLDCPTGVADTGAALRARDFAIAAPLGGSGASERARFRAIATALVADPAALARLLTPRDTAAAIGLREAIRCHLRADADGALANATRKFFEYLLASGHPAAPIFASVYETAAAGTVASAVTATLADSLSCGLRILAVRRGEAAKAADPCWRAQFVFHMRAGLPARSFAPLTDRPPAR